MDYDRKRVAIKNMLKYFVCSEVEIWWLDAPEARETEYIETEAKFDRVSEKNGFFYIFPKQATAKCLSRPIGPRTHWNVFLDSYYVGLWYFGWKLSWWYVNWIILCYFYYFFLSSPWNCLWSWKWPSGVWGVLGGCCGHTQGGAYKSDECFVYFKPQHHLKSFGYWNFSKLWNYGELDLIMSILRGIKKENIECG